MKSVPCTTISVPPLAGPLSGDRLTSVGRGTSRKVAAVVSAWFPAVSVACGVMTTVALSSVGTGAVKRYLQGASWGPGATVHTSRRRPTRRDRRAQGAEKTIAVIGDERDGDLGSRRDEAARDRTFDA